MLLKATIKLRLCFTALMTVQRSKMATKPENFPFILLVDINNFYKELNAYIHFVIFGLHKS